MSSSKTIQLTGGEQGPKFDFEIKPWQQMISSCTGSFITSVLVTPLDVVKIRLQAQQKEFMKNKCFLFCNGLMDHVCICNGIKSNGKINKCNYQYGMNQQSNTTSATSFHLNNFNRNLQCQYHSLSVKNLTDKQIQELWYRRPNYFNGTLDAMIKISKNEGITSLWSGLPPTLVMAIPATVMYFTIYDQLVASLRKRFNGDDTRNALMIPVMAGGSARLVAATVISPLEMIRTKMQSQKLSYREIGTAIRQLIKTEGFLRLWNGLNATLLRDVPFSCLYWLNYETFKRLLKPYNTNVQSDPLLLDDYNFAFSFISGAVSGAIAATVTLPFDVVKTHKQIELGENLATDQMKRTSRRTIDILRKIYNDNGYRGLFTGIAPRLIKVAPACAIMISTYEAGKSFFRKYNYSKKINKI